MAQPLKPYSTKPSERNVSPTTNQWMDWATSALNQIIGQNNVPQNQGFQALSQHVVNPQTNQITSAGSRMQSIATALMVVPGATSITFYWDGTNGSELLRIYRDDNTVEGPFSGKFLITGLAPGTKYYFYPYFDEPAQQVNWAFVSGVSVGTPGVAFLLQNIPAAQQQFLRTRVPLALNLATVGVTTGAAPMTGGTGGGGGSGGGGRYQS
jgi:hypothetical protein